MATINKSTNNKCWSALVGGMQIGAATMENSMEVPQKIKYGTALWPSDATSGYISKETWNTNSKEYSLQYYLQ